MQHFKHAILQQNISILIHQFGSGFFMKGTGMLAVKRDAPPQNTSRKAPVAMKQAATSVAKQGASAAVNRCPVNHCRTTMQKMCT
jgi:hypothetical protein